MSNLSRFDLPEFNDLYQKAERMRDSPERTQLYRRMSQLVVGYAPWVLHAYRIENIVVHPWVHGYKYNTFDPHAWMYYDVDVEKRRAATR
jgi:ABC-type transport system substrate-binding protein